MSAEGTALCKIFGGARKIEEGIQTRESNCRTQGRFPNLRMSSQLLTYRESNPSTQHRRAAGGASACTAQTVLVTALP